MKASVLTFIIIFVAGEVIATAIYFLVGVLGKEKGAKLSGLGILKGGLERIFLFLSLTNGFPQSLIVFGTLKIATRFKKESKISNDYFLIGNLISLMLGISYYMIWNNYN
ncbi:hypothetical protein QQ020_32050 [Fulvivirgaceae bacterium BMA12]|uniref:Uncharacterized protein n=1 Tax=Agaribacillus aureus TaxID=3051825 RepID=A0ABT8LG22_9BACT|nr:hypothetical protein [Fulvivirgaceae bacterium BMA12]